MAANGPFALWVVSLMWFTHVKTIPRHWTLIIFSQNKKRLQELFWNQTDARLVTRFPGTV